MYSITYFSYYFLYLLFLAKYHLGQGVNAAYLGIAQIVGQILGQCRPINGGQNSRVVGNTVLAMTIYLGYLTKFWKVLNFILNFILVVLTVHCSFFKR